MLNGIKNVIWCGETNCLSVNYKTDKLLPFKHCCFLQEMQRVALDVSGWMFTFFSDLIQSCGLQLVTLPAQPAVIVSVRNVANLWLNVG